MVIVFLWLPSQKHCFSGRLKMTSRHPTQISSDHPCQYLEKKNLPVMTPLTFYQPERSELVLFSFFVLQFFRPRLLWCGQAEKEASVSSICEVFPKSFKKDLRSGFYWVIPGLTLSCPEATVVKWKGCDLICSLVVLQSGETILFLNALPLFFKFYFGAGH